MMRWRRRRDSNPRYAINVYSLSRGAPSATRPLLRILSSNALLSQFVFGAPSALLGALRLALRVAVVPPALLRGLRPLGQPLGHFSVFCCQTHHFCSSQRRREDITPNFIYDMTGRYKIVANSLIRLLSSCPTPPSRLSKTVCHLRLSHAPFSLPAENNRMRQNADTPCYPKKPAILVAT